MSKAFTVTVGNVTLSNYSVYSYVKDAIGSSIDGLSDVVSALYAYSNAAACTTLPKLFDSPARHRNMPRYFFRAQICLCKTEISYKTSCVLSISFTDN